MNKKYFIFRKLKTTLLSFSTFFFIMLFWQLIIMYFRVPNYVIPTPLNVIYYISGHKKSLFINTFITSLEAFIGLSLASLVSVLLGAITLYASSIIRILYKVLLLIQIVPLIAIAPLVTMWIGFSISAKIFIVFTICLFPCLVSFLRGSLNIDYELFYLLKSMGANKYKIFKIIIFPSNCYSLFSGLKIAVTYSVTGAVIAEYLGAEKGIGVYLARSISSFDTEALFANIFFIIIITLLFYKIVSLIEKVISPWHYKTTLEIKNNV